MVRWCFSSCILSHSCSWQLITKYGAPNLEQLVSLKMKKWFVSFDLIAILLLQVTENFQALTMHRAIACQLSLFEYYGLIFICFIRFLCSQNEIWLFGFFLFCHLYSLYLSFSCVLFFNIRLVQHCKDHIFSLANFFVSCSHSVLYPSKLYTRSFK